MCNKNVTFSLKVLARHNIFRLSRDVIMRVWCFVSGVSDSYLKKRMFQVTTVMRVLVVSACVDALHGFAGDMLVLTKHKQNQKTGFVRIV